MPNSSFSWEFACPKYVNFTDSKVLELNDEDVDSYFDLEHEFSFSSHNLSEALKVESILAQAETMTSPYSTPSRPASSTSNYRTPNGDKSDLESDEVFYTTRKSYSLRETECRRLTQIGASPYRIPGGTTASKRKSKRTPFQPKLIEENAKQIEDEEILVQDLVKILFLDDENEPAKQKDENDEPSTFEPILEKENSYESPQKVMEKSALMNVTQDSNDYSMELMAVSTDIVTECVTNVCSENDNSMSPLRQPIKEVDENVCCDNDESMSPLRQEMTVIGEKISEKSFHGVDDEPVESLDDHAEVNTPEVVEENVYHNALDVFSASKNEETSETLETKSENCEAVVVKIENLPIEVKETEKDQQVTESRDKVAVDEKKEEKAKIGENKENLKDEKKKNDKKQENIPEIRVSPAVNNKSASTSSDEGYSKSIGDNVGGGGFTSDNCWTDVDTDTDAPGTSKTQEKRRRPLRRESFIKPTATLPSTVKKTVDPQKRLWRLLSYTAPPRNKYRSLAELSKDFETKGRVYTPSVSKVVKHWTPTKPVSPKLTACKRKRTLTCVSHKEQEENIAQSIKKNTFKATPFNKKTYLSTVNVGVKRVDPKPTTKPIPFSFLSEKRIEARRSKVSADLFNKLTTK